MQVSQGGRGWGVSIVMHMGIVFLLKFSGQQGWASLVAKTTEQFAKACPSVLRQRGVATLLCCVVLEAVRLKQGLHTETRIE